MIDQTFPKNQVIDIGSIPIIDLYIYLYQSLPKSKYPTDLHSVGLRSIHSFFLENIEKLFKCALEIEEDDYIELVELFDNLNLSIGHLDHLIKVFQFHLNGLLNFVQYQDKTKFFVYLDETDVLQPSVVLSYMNTT